MVKKVTGFLDRRKFDFIRSTRPFPTGTPGERGHVFSEAIQLPLAVSRLLLLLLLLLVMIMTEVVLARWASVVVGRLLLMMEEVVAGSGESVVKAGLVVVGLLFVQVPGPSGSEHQIRRVDQIPGRFVAVHGLSIRIVRMMVLVLELVMASSRNVVLTRTRRG